MDGNGFLCIIFLFLIASDCSTAYNFRKLIGAASTDGSNETNVSPSPSPVSSGGNKESKANPVDGGKSEGEKHKDSKSSNPVDGGKPKEKEHKDPKSSNDATKVNPKGLRSDDTENPPTEEEFVGEKSHEEKNEGQFDSNLGSQPQETCDGSTRTKDLVLLIQNEGGSTVKVNVTISASLRESYEIPKHRTEGINVSQMIDINIPTKIVLQAGNRECLLQIGPHQSKGDFLQRLPSYYKQLTPIYGAYLVFLISLVVGGTWACCKIRKRKRHGGVVPYQELGMGVSESASAVNNLESAEGWDDGWDDDWGEDKAVKSPGGRHAGSISSSGLTARPDSKDG